METKDPARSVPRQLQTLRRVGPAKSIIAAETQLSEYESYYAVIRKIPRGRVMTYGDVARLAGRPTSARRVGYALYCVADRKVPWWRVLNARGEISLRTHSGPGGPEDEQRFLLLREGVELDEQGRVVDFLRYRYQPRPRPEK